MSQAKSNYHEQEWPLTTFPSKFDFNTLFKRVIKMAEIKAVWIFLNAAGLTAYIWALFIAFADVDAVTKIILSVIGALYGIVRIIITSYAARRKHRLEMVEIRRLEGEEKDKALARREREIEIIRLEQQLSIQ